MIQPFLLIALSSPSGTGKTTLCRRLLTDLPSLGFSISTTTRTPRPGEVDGVAYHFVTHEHFQSMIDEDAFVEWADVHGQRYGTTRDEIESRRLDGHGGSILFDVDYRGSRQIKAAYPEAINIFLLPPSMAELERRIRSRGTESEEQVELRLRNAKQEIEHSRQFDYIVVNDDLDSAYEKLKGIVLAEGCREALQRDATRALLEEW